MLPVGLYGRVSHGDHPHSPAMGGRCLSLLPGSNRLWLRSGRLWGTTLSAGTDRKSTRLNSSPSQISYAVFCLETTNNQNVKKRPACSELRWAYCNHKATNFASYLTGGDSRRD